MKSFPLSLLRSGPVFGLILLLSISPRLYAYDYFTVSQPGLPPPYNQMTGPYKSIALEASQTVTGDTIALGTYGFPTLVAGDRVVFTLTGGATFADAAYSLEEWAGGAGTGQLDFAVLQTASPSGSTSIEFLMQESAAPRNLADVPMFILSGAAIAGQTLNVNLPQVPGVNITLQAEVFDSGSNSKGTASIVLFNSTLPPGLTEQQTQHVIANQVAQQMQRRAGFGPGLSGLITGNGFGGRGISGVGGQLAPVVGQLEQSVLGGPLPVTLSLDLGSNQTSGNFAFSTNAYRQWQRRLNANAGDDAGRSAGGTLPDRSEAALAATTNLWVKGHYGESTDTRRGAEVKSKFGIVYLGADVRYNADTRVGMMAELDWFDESAAGTNPDGEGQGWMIGPYLVSRLDDRMILDVRAAYGQSDNKITPMGTFTDSYDTERWLLETNLTGQWRVDAWDIEPAIGLLYMTETQKAYTDTNGQPVGEQTTSLGSLNFGPTFYYNVNRGDGTLLRPMLGLKGIWDFATPKLYDYSGQRLDDEALRAQVKLGIQAHLPNGSQVEGSYTYGGIGVSGQDVHGLELSFSTVLKTPGPFKNTQLSGAYRLDAAETQQLNIELGIPFH